VPDELQAETGRILGLMPHPERHQFPWQSPRFHRDGPASPDGLRLFTNAVESLRGRESKY